MESRHDVGRSFGGFTESQIRTGVSGSGFSPVKRVKVDLVAGGWLAFAARQENVDGLLGGRGAEGKYVRIEGPGRMEVDPTFAARLD